MTGHLVVDVLCDLVRLVQVFLEVHALTLANEAPVNLPLGKRLVNVLAALLLGNQLLVNILTYLEEEEHTTLAQNSGFFRHFQNS